MAKDSTFNDVRPRTPRAAALRREKKLGDEMARLLDHASREAFAGVLICEYNLSPGSPQYAAALAVWDEYQSSRPRSR